MVKNNGSKPYEQMADLEVFPYFWMTSQPLKLWDGLVGWDFLRRNIVTRMAGYSCFVGLRGFLINLKFATVIGKGSEPKVYIKLRI